MNRYKTENLVTPVAEHQPCPAVPLLFHLTTRDVHSKELLDMMTNVSIREQHCRGVSDIVKGRLEIDMKKWSVGVAHRDSTHSQPMLFPFESFS